jgi:porin
MKLQIAPLLALSFGAMTSLSFPALADSEATQNSAAGAVTAPATESEATPVSPATQQAAPGSNPSETSVNGAPGFWRENFLTGNWDGFRDTLKKDGIALAPVLTAEVFGNPSGGARRGAISDGLVNLPLDADLERATGGVLKDTTFHVNAFYIYGTSLSQNYIGDFSNISNIAAYDTLRLDELWAQKAFWNKQITVKVGNMAVDNEFFQSTSAALFINGTFGAFTLIANDVPDAPVYPLASPGVRVQVLPDPRFYVMAGVYGLDNNSLPNVNNKNGTLFSFDRHSGVLVMTEAGYLLNQQPNDKGLPGSYRLGSWLDTGNATTFASQAAAANGTGQLQGAGANFGIYGVVDQQIYSHDTEAISIFTRVGGAPSNTNFVDYYVDGGFNFTGFMPGRPLDLGGLAIARSHVSNDFSNAQEAEGGLPSTAETVVEATYKVQLAPWWNVQPDFQYIVTPSGVQGSHNAVVLGLRTSVAF